MQEEIIRAVLDGRDCVALLPTGGGKSICFQLPALAMEGLCVVISPLVALMEDQVTQLRSRGIKALHLAGGMKEQDVVALLDNAIFGNYKFLYLSPERLQQDFVQEAIRKMNICLIAIDEMHCISQWGHDFRPAYKKIAILRELQPMCPFIGLTATATTKVLQDSVEQLQLEEPLIFRQSFFRPNLAYMTAYCEDKMYRLEQLLKRPGDSAIVYVRSRRLTLEIAEKLRLRGVTAAAYHGGMDPLEKRNVTANWMAGHTQIIVATNAFGMGIDKPDVRFVIHIQLPDSLESYFQEAGRAGRDGHYAEAWLLYNEEDKRQVQRQFVDSLPSLKDLKKVYRHLVNYFQVSYGEGQDESFPFAFAQFCRVYELSFTNTYNALNSLDRLGVIRMSQQFGRNSTLMFTSSSSRLLDYFKRNPGLSLIGKTLLRIYGGIFEMATPVNLDLVASKTGQSINQVTEALLRFEKDDMAEVHISDTDSRISFLMPREDDRTLIPFSREIEWLNRQKAQQVRSVLDYVENEEVCRSIQLTSYFDETQCKPCGICSVCLNKKASARPTDINTLGEKLKEVLQQESLDVRALLARIEYPEEEVIACLRAMLDSKMIRLNELNRFIINK